MISYDSQASKKSYPTAMHKKGGRAKYATLAECLALTDGNVHVALVLQKISHYCAKPPFEIDKEMYSAPTTRMLVEELGISEAMVNKAIRKLKEDGVIKVRVGRFNRSPRRYVRLLKDPIEHAASDISNLGGTSG